MRNDGCLYAIFVSRDGDHRLMGTTHEIELGKVRLGAGNPLFLIAGPCVIENELHA